jgi:hypothetical protein
MDYRVVWVVERNGRKDKHGFWMPVDTSFDEADAYKKAFAKKEVDLMPYRVVRYTPFPAEEK